MVNQVETHPFNRQTEAQKWMEKYSVQIEAWAPFGEGRGATMYKIERETPYSNDYNTVAYGEAKTEADSNARPPLKEPLSADEMKSYGAVIVMYPIWWHTAPMVVGTFLETYDLSGAHIYPLTQSASMDVCAKKKGTPTVHDGLGTKSTSAVDGYLKSNGLTA